MCVCVLVLFSILQSSPIVSYLNCALRMFSEWYHEKDEGKMHSCSNKFCSKKVCKTLYFYFYFIYLFFEISKLKKTQIHN